MDWKKTHLIKSFAGRQMNWFKCQYGKEFRFPNSQNIVSQVILILAYICSGSVGRKSACEWKVVGLIPVSHTKVFNKNSLEADVAPALGKVTGAWNLGQVHRVIVHAWKVCQKQLLSKNYCYSYYCYREMHIIARLNVKSLQSHRSMKSRSRAPGHSVCLKNMLRTITMQGLTLAAITASQKHTLMLDNVKSWQNHSSTKSRSRHRVIVCAWRVCQGQLQGKVWHSNARGNVK